MKNKIRKFIAEHSIISDGDHILIGVSGGGDSMFLSEVLVELYPKVNFALAVVDHGLRDVSNEIDLVVSHGNKLGIKTHVLKVSVDSKNGIQAGARKARYKALRSLMNEIRADKLAVGHNAEDQVETTLSALFRGKSMKAAAGMVPIRADGLIRPILECNRNEIRSYLNRNGIKYADDPSNHNNKFERVKIRSLIPEIEKIDCRAVEHLFHLSSEIADNEESLDSIASAILNKCLGKNVNEFNILDEFANSNPSMKRRVLGMWLERNCLTPKRTHFDEIFNVVESPGHKTRAFIRNKVLNKKSSTLYLSDYVGHAFERCKEKQNA